MAEVGPGVAHFKAGDEVIIATDETFELDGGLMHFHEAMAVMARPDRNKVVINP